MTSTNDHQAAHEQADAAMLALMGWVADAKKSLTSDKLDATARARIGELLLNAAKFASERSDSLRKAAREAEIRADRAARERR